jgi:large-conductance mechanosensitive channel
VIGGFVTGGNPIGIGIAAVLGAAVGAAVCSFVDNASRPGQ